jgi:hypothetical protein
MRASHPAQSLHLPPFQSFPAPSIPTQQSGHWSRASNEQPQARGIGRS